MWYVFLWLNVYSMTVLCQRVYIPHWSEYIEPLLFEGRDRPPPLYLPETEQRNRSRLWGGPPPGLLQQGPGDRKTAYHRPPEKPTAAFPMRALQEQKPITYHKNKVSPRSFVPDLYHFNSENDILPYYSPINAIQPFQLFSGKTNQLPSKGNDRPLINNITSMSKVTFPSKIVIDNLNSWKPISSNEAKCFGAGPISIFFPNDASQQNAVKNRSVSRQKSTPDLSSDDERTLPEDLLDDIEGKIIIEIKNETIDNVDDTQKNRVYMNQPKGSSLKKPRKPPPAKSYKATMAQIFPKLHKVQNPLYQREYQHKIEIQEQLVSTKKPGYKKHYRPFISGLPGRPGEEENYIFEKKARSRDEKEDKSNDKELEQLEPEMAFSRNFGWKNRQEEKEFETGTDYSKRNKRTAYTPKRKRKREWISSQVFSQLQKFRKDRPTQPSKKKYTAAKYESVSTTVSCPTVTCATSSTSEITTNSVTEGIGTLVTNGTSSTTGTVVQTTEMVVLSGSTRPEPPATVRLVPNTGGNNSKKKECEEKSGQECVCCMDSAVKELSVLLKTAGSSRETLSALAAFTCTDYKPINASYRLTTDRKPRLISKKQKELIVDDKNGPKEMVHDTFQQLLNQGAPNEGIDFYIFPSTTVKIPCFSANDIQLSPNTADSAVYVWTHGNNIPITEGRALEDEEHRGALTLKEASISDSDTYTCTVSYIDPDEGSQKLSFLHSLYVVQLPKIVLHTAFHYRGPCDQEDLELFELFLPQQMEEAMCSCGEPVRKICSIEIHNPLCQGRPIRHERNKRSNDDEIWRLEPKSKSQDEVETSEITAGDRTEMSLDYQVDVENLVEISKASGERSRCNPFCQLKMLLKVVQILRESLAHALSHQVITGTGDTFHPDVTSMNIKYIIACGGGLYLHQGFCIPCPVNSYSDEGSTKCTPCPLGYRQNQIGSKSCQKCPHPFASGCSSTMVAALIIVTAILLLCCICVCFCKKRKKPKTSEISVITHDASRKTSSWKTNHAKKRKRHIQPEPPESLSEPPSLPSEDFSD